MVDPLALQSALAGVMLAVSAIVANVPQLAAHSPFMTEMRLDLLSGPPQVLGRPRQRTPGCLCGDPVYLQAARAL